MQVNELKEYKELFKAVKERVYQSQYEALKAVNKELINVYWFIGQSIVERQQAHGWGKSIVENLAEDLQKEFPGVKGFSSSNLWRMKNFYEQYHGSEKLAPLVREIGWSHNIIILEKCKDDLEREFYIKMTRKYGWTKAILVHQVESGAYERRMVNQTNFDQVIEEKYRHQARLAVKDSYNFGFLEMAEDYKERDENPSIGIIVCRSKSRTVVEYALRSTNKPMGVADYSLSKTLPRELKGILPSPEELARGLEGLE